MLVSGWNICTWHWLFSYCNIRVSSSRLWFFPLKVMFPHSDGSWFRGRHRDGEVLQHQMPGLRPAAKCGGSGCNGPGVEDARRRPQRKIWNCSPQDRPVLLELSSQRLSGQQSQIQFIKFNYYTAWHEIPPTAFYLLNWATWIIGSVKKGGWKIGGNKK